MRPQRGPEGKDTRSRWVGPSMNGTFFYIGLGLGLATACGLRPFLPVLLAGALASGGDLGVHFSGHFEFLQEDWWLLAVSVALVLAYAAQLLLKWPTSALPGQRPGPFAAALEGIAYGAGALLFAGTLEAHGDAWWPGIVGGLAAAALAARAVGPIIAGARARLPDRAAKEALTVYADAAAVLLAAFVALLHPLGYVAVAMFALLFVRVRSRAGERYAGLRILGR